MSALCMDDIPCSLKAHISAANKRKGYDGSAQNPFYCQARVKEAFAHRSNACIRLIHKFKVMYSNPFLNLIIKIEHYALCSQALSHVVTDIIHTG